MKSNEPDIAMSTAVFELLVANPADVDCFCATSTDKGPLRNLSMALESALTRGGGCPHHDKFA